MIKHFDSHYSLVMLWKMIVIISLSSVSHFKSAFLSKTLDRKMPHAANRRRLPDALLKISMNYL